MSVAVKAGAMPAAPVTLAWDASADKSVAGYAVYYKLAGSQSTAPTRVNVGKTVEATISNLQANTNYLFYVVACKTDGGESAPTNPLVYSPPAISSLTVFPFGDGTMDVLFRAAVGSQCRVEYSSTLKPSDWHSLGNTIADSQGYVEINDDLQPRPLMRFYRGVLLNP